MWSDTLQAIERAHLLRVGAWGAACVVAGLVLVAVVAMRRVRAPFVLHFGIQTAAWGAIEVAIAAWALPRVRPRDHTGAVALARTLWLNVGLEVLYVAVGLTLLVGAWRIGRRMGGVGAGVGVIVQGVALLALDLGVLRLIVPSL